MIRLIQRNLIIPRGDSGSFSVPVLEGFQQADEARFTIIDLRINKLICNPIPCEFNAGTNTLTVSFTHENTVNLPVGRYRWDIKSYKNPQFVDGELVNGEEVDSYYAAYSLPICEIRQTGDKLLTINDSPLVEQDFDMINATLNQLHNSNTEVQQYKQEIEALHHEERLTAAETTIQKLNENINDIEGELILNIKPIEHLFIGSSGVLTVLPNDRPERLICIKGEPNTKYIIKKNTSTIMRAGCGASDSLTAGTQLSSFIGHIRATTNSLVVTTDDTNIYIYIHLFSDADDDSIKSIEKHTKSLKIIKLDNKKGINILLVGNSYTYDEFVYVPALLKEAMPDLQFNLCILYHDSGALADHIEHMTQNTVYAGCSTYSSVDNGWEIRSNKTLSEIINRYPYDIIGFTEASAIVDAEVSKTNLKTLIDGYSLMINHPAHFFWHLSHRRAGQNTFEQKLTITQDILNNTGIYDIFPSGTAIENAGTTSLDDLGANGHMRYDSTQHLQEGIPRLVGAYANFLKICELIGQKKIGIYGSKIRPTDEWDDEQNIPMQHGNSVGVTDANCILAAKCAIAAIKKPLEVTNCSNM